MRAKYRILSPVMDLTTQLMRAASEFCDRTGMSRARLATIVINDGKFFDRVERGGGLTVKTYEKFMAYFAEHAIDAREPAQRAG